MRTLILLVLLTLTVSISPVAQYPAPKFELPELHTIRSVTLGPSYSCRPVEESLRGYENTALFLSSYAKLRNSPDLLFNGACRSEDYLEAAVGGDSMSLIADLGANVPLEEVTASRAFNLQKVGTAAAYSKFVQTTKVQINHTYAVLLNEREKRGLYIFTVVNHVPNEKVELKYAVKSYQIMPQGQVIAAGFDWEKRSN